MGVEPGMGDAALDILLVEAPVEGDGLAIFLHGPGDLFPEAAAQWLHPYLVIPEKNESSRGIIPRIPFSG